MIDDSEETGVLYTDNPESTELFLEWGNALWQWHALFPDIPSLDLGSKLQRLCPSSVSATHCPCHSTPPPIHTLKKKQTRIIVIVPLSSQKRLDRHRLILNSLPEERLRVQIGCRDVFIVVPIIPQLEHVAIQIASIKREFRRDVAGFVVARSGQPKNLIEDEVIHGAGYVQLSE